MIPWTSVVLAGRILIFSMPRLYAAGTVGRGLNAASGVVTPVRMTTPLAAFSGPLALGLGLGGAVPQATRVG
ncbi:hypothetical protein GCM10025781_10860 [Kocuria gwangalliensis]|uniref:Uncharacterized protein n=1 Tax=Kocuria gwangalliensis TaxID=501592 RepID=A0ABP8WUD8_9MICC